MLLGHARISRAADVVLYASDFATVSGHWTRSATAGAAGGSALASADQGWSQTAAPLATPTHVLETSFTVAADTSYHVWLRMRAAGDSKYNESVWVQFSQALDANGSAVYAIGSTGALLVNLERCSGCGVSGWGWQDGAYWLRQSVILRFATGGTQRIRIQTREDGVSIDQVVLSDGAFLNTPPGAATNDTTIVPKPTSSSPTPAPTPSSTPYNGSRVSLPGTVRAELFDSGGEGVAYHDTTAGNAGGAFRSGDVDLEATTEGGYDVGWTAPGEWLRYSVDVTTSGTYTAHLRVASPTGAVLRLGFDGAGGTYSQVNVPATGGWQAWTTVSVPVTLGAGAQVMTVRFDTSGANLQKVVVASGGTTSPPPASEPGPYGGVAVTLPGTVQAENFDTGTEGVSYHDSTAGNAGGAYRTSGVDLESTAGGGFNVGWTAPGEWLNYTVQVPAAGSYVASLRVASPGGGALHVGFNAASSVWAAVNVPATGGWQQWTTIQVPVTLGAGTQQLTVLFDTGGLNLDSVRVDPSGATAPPPSGNGTLLPVVTWNIQINDSSEAHARLAMDLLLQQSPRRPEIIVIEEAHLPHLNTYLDELQKQTGRTWHGVFATHCAPGTWNGSGCSSTWYQGVGIFTTFNIVNSSSILMPYADCWTAARAALRAALDVNGTLVQVFGTHLQSDSCGDMSSQRRSSMAQLKDWAARYPAPQLAGGDFNGEAAEVNSTGGMLPDFVDTWSVGTGGRFTAYGPNPTKKIDYWFVDDGGRAVPQASEVLYSTGTASDHYPVYLAVTVK